MDGRLLMNRQLSRKLVALWTSSNAEALGLLRRILPAGLLGFLESTDAVPADADADGLGEGVPNRDNLKVPMKSTVALKTKTKEKTNSHRRLSHIDIIHSVRIA